MGFTRSEHVTSQVKANPFKLGYGKVFINTDSSYSSILTQFLCHRIKMNPWFSVLPSFHICASSVCDFHPSVSTPAAVSQIGHASPSLSCLSLLRPPISLKMKMKSEQPKWRSSHSLTSRGRRASDSSDNVELFHHFTRGLPVMKFTEISHF